MTYVCKRIECRFIVQGMVVFLQTHTHTLFVVVVFL